MWFSLFGSIKLSYDHRKRSKYSSTVSSVYFKLCVVDYMCGLDFNNNKLLLISKTYAKLFKRSFSTQFCFLCVHIRDFARNNLTSTIELPTRLPHTMWGSYSEVLTQNNNIATANAPSFQNDIHPLLHVYTCNARYFS